MTQEGLIGQTGDHSTHVFPSRCSLLYSAPALCWDFLQENRWLSESVTSIILGFITGIIVLVTSEGLSSHVLQFNEELFFIYLLPPIIFNAGIKVKKKQFFHNFVSIMFFGVVGVFISFVVISAGCKFVFPKFGLEKLLIEDYLALGAIFSATDSVSTLQVRGRRLSDMSKLKECLAAMRLYALGAWINPVLNQDETPLLYSLVFGEGVVNDATSVVLFRAVQNLNLDKVGGTEVLKISGNFLQLFFCSTFLGVGIGLASAYIIKTLRPKRHSTHREIAIMSLMAYLSYISAELFYLSGILTVFFCGIVMSHYTWHNVTKSSRVSTKHVFATMSSIAETVIFLYVGMDALDVDKWKKVETSGGESFGLFMTLMVFIMIGQAIFVFPLSTFSNFMRRHSNIKISFRQQIIIWWVGLIRGAVSIALAYNQFTTSGNATSPEHATVITTTMGIVLFSTMLEILRGWPGGAARHRKVFGMATKRLIRFLFPESRSPGPDTRESPRSPSDPNVPLLVTYVNQRNGNSRVAAPRQSSLTMFWAAPTSVKFLEDDQVFPSISC